jgi:hypothetical protein
MLLHLHVIDPNVIEIDLFDYLLLVLRFLLLEDVQIFQEFYHNYFLNEF